MNLKIFVLAAVSAAALTAAPAMAQGPSPVGAYGNLGGAHITSGGDNFTALGGRLGARFGNYLGVEGEGAFGVDGAKGTAAGVPYKSSLSHSFAGYAVGFVPVTPKFDLFARAGYGTTRAKVETAGTSVSDSHDSWNYGGGGQYFFDAKNGVRADYTRQDFRHDAGHANVWGLSYVRKF
jgi:hypothetical protein